MSKQRGFPSLKTIITCTLAAASIGTLAVLSNPPSTKPYVPRATANIPETRPWQFLERAPITNVSVVDPRTKRISDDLVNWYSTDKVVDGRIAKSIEGLEAKVDEKILQLNNAGYGDENYRADVTRSECVIPDASLQGIEIVEYFESAHEFVKTHPDLDALVFDLDPRIIHVNSPQTDTSQINGRILAGIARVEAYDLRITDKKTNKVFADYHVVPRPGSACDIDFTSNSHQITQAYVFLSTGGSISTLAYPFAEFIPYALREEFTRDVVQRGLLPAQQTIEALSESIAEELTIQMAAEYDIPTSHSRVQRFFDELVADNVIYEKVPQARKWLGQNSIPMAIQLYQEDPAKFDQAIDAQP